MIRAIIIRATSGIGKGLALKLVEENCKVGFTGRRTQLLDDLKSQKPDLFYPKTFDITESKKIV